MVEDLLTTKFYPPPLRPGFVDRSQLVQKLNQSFQQGSRLTLFSAPAGYGKTTLALAWLANLALPHAWLSVDQTDNHPVQFFQYLVAAIQKLADQSDGLFPFKFEHCEARKVEELQSKLTAFINQIASAAASFVLVLDDYHLITDLEVHRMMEFLIDHQPAQLHLVIITRQDPLLPLAKLRSRGQVTEIRLGDLRFTPEETTAFLNGTMRLALIDEQIALLASRTEGWIAGLQLAALSLSDRSTGESASTKEIADFIQNFTGNDRHIVDYLLDEVLFRQPEDVQQFLLRTSVLKRLCAPLCDALLEPHPPTKEACGSRAILEYLERASLFIIPLDNRRQWYRYHHLFADLLSSRLQSAYPELVPPLHRAASQWYEQEGWIEEAVDHALLAEDFDRALSLIEQTARASIWTSGELPVLLNWAKRLPENVLMTRPRLCLYHARALFFAGQVDAAQAYLKSAAQLLEALPPNERSTDELWGVLYTNQATFAAMNGESQAAIRLAQQALGLLPEDHFSSRAMAFHAIGIAENYAGRMHPAEKAYEQAIILARLAGNRSFRLDAAASLASTLVLSGRLRKAMQVCEEALAIDATACHLPAAGTIYIMQAEILLAMKELSTALEKMKIGIGLARQLGWAHVLWSAYADLSYIQHALGDPADVRETMQQLELLVRQYPLPAVARMAEDWQTRIAAAEGDRESATSWADAHQASLEEGVLAEFHDLTLAVVWLSEKRYTEALSLLQTRLKLARDGGRGYKVIEIFILRSIAFQALGDENAARESLTQALILAEPEGILQPFLDRADALLELLQRIYKKRDGAASVQARRILALVQPSPLPSRTMPPSVSAGITLLEPLSDREMEVLHLIAEGLSNPQIAARLYLSVNTLRSHTTSIYQKLDVHNRMEAVVRARQLGLLQEK